MVMKKYINQQFTVIELEKLLNSITKILNDDFRNIRSFSSVKNYTFTLLIADFLLLLDFFVKYVTLLFYNIFYLYLFLYNRNYIFLIN